MPIRLTSPVYVAEKGAVICCGKPLSTADAAEYLAEHQAAVARYADPILARERQIAAELAAELEGAIRAATAHRLALELADAASELSGWMHHLADQMEALAAQLQPSNVIPFQRRS